MDSDEAGGAVDAAAGPVVGSDPQGDVLGGYGDDLGTANSSVTQCAAVRKYQG